MVMDTGALWLDLVDDVRWYPSPHNSQPIKLRAISDTAAVVYYDLDLGLPAESFGIPFGHVCAGVFLESLSVVAAARGYRIIETLEHSDMDFAAADRLHLIGTVRLEPTAGDDEVQSTAQQRLAAFRSRRTSRLPYDSKIVGNELLASASSIAAAQGYEFRSTTDAHIVSLLVQINQKTLFSDLRNDAVYAEIMHWLRFSKDEAAALADGLSAETMIMPGPVLRFAMRHRGLWSFPLIGGLIRAIYLRTMRGVRQLGWLEGSFAGPADYLEAGRTFMRVWLFFTEKGVCLHPFGTVITNPASHAEFVRAAGIHEDADRMAWMLFRFGYSARPPAAHRRPATSTLLSPLPEDTSLQEPLRE
ncbi:hypothetical protein QF038_001147 [Pseudarthrobacter sp. W1I19]|uniref:hypothetical protein n=1 Tax=Pseudarthrobacter sp. W1I19 TaxID=3042288 RepID=UPI0027875ED7|nr:hypothetical protein [Pseudarthrobacter sp. W1I19]MDQ0922639.1 hypothetical protein [Pseudarthrobacter sp. W1I19]